MYEQKNNTFDIIEVVKESIINSNNKLFKNYREKNINFKPTLIIIKNNFNDIDLDLGNIYKNNKYFPNIENNEKYKLIIILKLKKIKK